MDRRSALGLFGSTAVATAFSANQAGVIVENAHKWPTTGESFGTGIDPLDRAVGQLVPGDVLAILGHRCAGKTTFALTIANHICGLYGKDAIYWGPHIDRDPGLTEAIRTMSANRKGVIRLRCMHQNIGGPPVSSGRLRIVIADDFNYHLSIVDRNWEHNAELLAEMVTWLKRTAIDKNCIVLPILNCLIDQDGPEDSDSHDWLDLEDFGMFGREIQTVGKVVLLERPSIYTGPFRRGKAITNVDIPKQCAVPSSTTGGVSMILDERRGLFREMTVDELRDSLGG